MYIIYIFQITNKENSYRKVAKLSLADTSSIRIYFAESLPSLKFKTVRADNKIPSPSMIPCNTIQKFRAYYVAKSSMNNTVTGRINYRPVSSRVFGVVSFP